MGRATTLTDTPATDTRETPNASPCPRARVTPLFRCRSRLRPAPRLHPRLALLSFQHSVALVLHNSNSNYSSSTHSLRHPHQPMSEAVSRLRTNNLVPSLYLNSEPVLAFGVRWMVTRAEGLLWHTSSQSDHYGTRDGRPLPLRAVFQNYTSPSHQQLLDLLQESPP